jgi:hypothetical protein
MERIWFKTTAERSDRPESPGSILTSVGYGGSSNLEVMAATIVIGLYLFAMSFWMTNAGRVFLISAPTFGLKLTR